MSFIAQLQDELAEFKKEGVYKRLNYLDSPQAPRVKMEGHGDVLILSSNNYLGLCAVPAPNLSSASCPASITDGSSASPR